MNVLILLGGKMGLVRLIDFFLSELRAMKIRDNTPDNIYNRIVLSTLHQIADVLCGEEKIIIQAFISKRLEKNG